MIASRFFNRLASAVRALTIFCCAIAFLLPEFAQAARAAELLPPYKERIFKYRKPLKVEDKGDFMVLPYSPKRDINKRDEIPVRKVKGFYVSSRPKRSEKDIFIEANGRKITHFAVGALKGGSRMTVIFLHGRDGSRHLGFDDERFGGNFNRVKNLMYRNGGIYISSDFADHKAEGTRDIAALIAHYRPKTKGKLVVACGSMGAFLCWRLMNVTKAANQIDGLVIMGGFADPDRKFLKSKFAKNPKHFVPIYIAHGGIDYVYKWQDAKAFYNALRKQSPGYPVKMVVFDGGKHGTPVRMMDWRLALNWIAAQK